MAGLMGAVDVLVQNAGGLSALEALAVGVPVITYRPIPGHGKANAAALDESGLAPWVREPGDLVEALRVALSEKGRRTSAARAKELFTADAAGVIAEAAADVAAPINGQLSGIWGWTSGCRTRRVVVVLCLLAASIWTSTAAARFAVAHGFQTADTAHQRALFVVVHPSGLLLPSELTGLERSHAALVVDASDLQRVGAGLAAAAHDRVTIVSAGAGPPYRTGLVSRRISMVSTARTVARITHHSPTLFLSRGDVDAVDITFLMRLSERILIPTFVVSTRGSFPILDAGDVVLLQCTTDADCGAGLRRIDQQAAASGLPLRDVGRIAA
jgi:processive 1,2-diacylglycerol beta-glucosyltransferase